MDILVETLSEARDNATFGTPDEFLGLAEPDGVPAPELDLFRDVDAAGTPAKIDLAMALEKAAAVAEPRIHTVESADYYDGSYEAAVVSTSGVRASSRESSAYVSVSVIASEGDDTQDGYGFAVGRELSDIDIDKAAADAAERATRLLGAQQAPTERLTVVLDPYVAAQFTSIIASTLNGESVLKGRSPFAERMGDNVASALVSLVDDPTDPRRFTASSTDGEGLATRKNVLIDSGELKSFVHNSYTARRANTVSTGSAVRGGYKTTPGVGIRAVSILPGATSRDDLIGAIDNGLLVTSVSAFTPE
jgi:PmbA protein